MEWTPARIREARTRKGLSQRELAAAIGMSLRAVTSWEQGQSVPGGIAGAALDRVFSPEPPAVDNTREALTHATDLELVAELTRRLAARRPAGESPG